MNRSKRRQEGQALILLALGLVAMLGMIGLVIDGGRAFAQRRSMQAAADAAAHAGAAKLQQSWNGSTFGSLTDQQVSDAAKTYAGYNGWDSASGQFYKTYVYADGSTRSQTLDSNVRGVLVQLSMPQGATFISAVGVYSWDIFARATAMFGSATSAPALPLGVNDDAFRGFNIWAGLQPANGSGNYGNFNFASIVPPGCAAGDLACYTNAMRNGSSAPINVGVAYAANTFDMSALSSATAQALQERIDQRPNETCTKTDGSPGFTMPSPRVVYLPIINGDVGGSTLIFIRFRAFFITNIAAPNGFGGCFVQVSLSNGGFDPNAVGTGYGGVTVMKLVRSPGTVSPLTVTVASLTNPAHASSPTCTGSGCETATLAVNTTPGAFCTVVVSDPSPSRAGGLGAKYADSSGRVVWTWAVDSTAPNGNWPVSIACTYQALVGRTSTILTIT